MTAKSSFKEIKHQADLCVVGGGLAGMLAAISAARHGARVALMQDRPVLGGNASSEIRMWVCGARGQDVRETGILEEIALENLYRNPYRIYSIWDSILYEKTRFQNNLTLLLNCSCLDAQMEGAAIRGVRGWQLTTQTWHTVEAGLFADCSGDSILAPLTGAEHRWGREAAAEFNEDIEPAQADGKTMGMSCLMQAREMPGPRAFIPPAWAYRFKTEDLPYKIKEIRPTENFWYMELGGEQDAIHDTEAIRDELLKVAFGYWDYIKNSGECDAANWELDWVGFLPGKRESRRYTGDHILTQNDLRAGGRFDDIVAYGGWPMDDHNPAGFRHTSGKGTTVYHQAPSPYGIPYRCLYSKNIDNLFFAGRNISVTHAAMSSTRVMATCALLGQAVGTAAAIAAAAGASPRQVGRENIRQLQQALMRDDCWLPGLTRAIPSITSQARLTASEGDPEPLRNGLDRPMGSAANAWVGPPGSVVEYGFGAATPVRELRFVFDSDLNRQTVSEDIPIPHYTNMLSNIRLRTGPLRVPPAMVKEFRVDYLDEQGQWRRAAQIDNNYQRLVGIPLQIAARAVRFVPEATWGDGEARVFAWEVG